jgi:haloalkane dehalogenase
MDIVRTADERFAELQGFPFAPHYVEVDDGEGGRLRIHYVDEGPTDGEVVWCMHGQPTWSYLYRKMIPPLVAAGYRVLAPDFVGFGRSDKPTQPQDYTYARHVAWMRAWVEALDLRAVTLVCQDWGGLIGLRVLAEAPDRFARLVVANTGLPDARGLAPEAAGPMRELYRSLPVVEAADLGPLLQKNEGGFAFMYWIKFCAENPNFTISEIVQLSSTAGLSPGQVRAYDAPFPDERYKAGPRRFPSLVPIFPDDPAVTDNRRAWEVLRRFDKPVLCAFSDRDPVTRGGEKRFLDEVPGTGGQRHVTIAGAGHFLQEDAGDRLAEAVIAFMRANPR